MLNDSGLARQLVVFKIQNKTKTILFFFVTFFHINDPLFHKTNSLGKTLDTRQKIFCGPLTRGPSEHHNVSV